MGALSDLKKVLFIVGPTASGKSQLSYQLAKKFNGVIVNCDSLQVYEGLNIGSAKPTKTEMALCPHYLFGHIENGDEYTAGRFRSDAIRLLKNTSHSLYIFVGGSGFYIKALVDGMFEETPIKLTIQNEVKNMKSKMSKEELFQFLADRDPAYAHNIHVNDTYRVSRALELVLSLNKTMKEIQDEFSSKSSDFIYPHRYLGVNPGREVLRERVALRLQKMLEAGFRQEVEKLLQDNLKTWKPLNSVGYKEMQEWLGGHRDERDFLSEVIKNTMRLAKRQMTWFKRNSEIEWLKGPLDPLSQKSIDFLSRD